ncbi:MAG: hypothetical protein A4E66_01932 [Syntrophus sp. PtaB.Bin001]|nr:MAG: hypothetical protein A4E66_01932 [Syntrophus sp. PtaB.Bin001]
MGGVYTLDVKCRISFSEAQILCLLQDGLKILLIVCHFGKYKI